MSRVKNDAVLVTRKRSQITLDLKPEFHGQSAFVVGFYLESMIQLYLNEFGHKVKFGAETQALYDQHIAPAKMRVACFTGGQKLVFDGLMRQIVSPANGDLADNMEMLIYAEQTFSTNRFEGDKAYKLVFTERHTGDHMGRILKMKHDLVEIYGPEVCAYICSALRESIKREQRKDVHFEGLTFMGVRESYLNGVPRKVRMFERAFYDQLKECSVADIKSRFPQVVAIVRFLESEALTYNQAA